jgi:hypothetical protein
MHYPVPNSVKISKKARENTGELTYFYIYTRQGRRHKSSIGVLDMKYCI